MYIYANLPDGISHYTHIISQESIYQFYTVFLLIYQQQKDMGCVPFVGWYTSYLVVSVIFYFQQK